MADRRLFQPRPHIIRTTAVWHESGSWSLSVTACERTDAGLQEGPSEYYSDLTASELVDALVAHWWTFLELPA